MRRRRSLLVVPFIHGPDNTGAPETGAPTWYSAIAAGTWGVAGGALSASGVGWSGTYPGGDGTTYVGVIEQWNGAVLATNGVYADTTFVDGPHVVCWGGGHTAYAGNELYAFGPLTDDSPAWRRLRDPTIPAPNNVDEDGSGNPVSRHTYNGVVYVPSANIMLACGGVFRYSSSGNVGKTHAYSFANSDPNGSQPWSSSRAAPPGAGPDVAVYEPSSGLVWMRADIGGNAGQAITYDVANDVYDYASFKTPGFTSFAGSSALDTSRGLWCIAHGSTVRFFRTTSLSNDYYTPSQTGTAPTTVESVLYDPIDDRFVFWVDNGKQLFFLDPPGTSPYEGGNAWTWSSTTPGSGSTPGTGTTNGTYSRFQYYADANMRCYVLVNAADQSVWAFRPSSAT